MDDWGDTVLEFKSLPTFIRTVLRRLSDPEFITGFWRKDFFSPVFFIRSVLRHLKNFYPDADEAFIGIYNSGAKHTVTGYHKDTGLPPPDYRWRGLMKFQKKFPIYSGHIIREKFVRIGLQKKQDIFFQQSIFLIPFLVSEMSMRTGYWVVRVIRLNKLWLTWVSKLISMLGFFWELHQ